MRARAAISVLCLTCAVAVAGGDPKPTAVDIKPIKDHLLAFEDPQGGTYVVLPGSTPRVFFAANGKQAYEQIIVTRSANGDAWSIGTWAPRISGMSPASIQRNEDGTFERWCGNVAHAKLEAVPADRAKLVIGKLQFLSSGITRRAHLLARDDAGVYYYVDEVAKAYGGQGYRVFVGKKGAMKQLPLTDVARDTGGEVYATKSGDVRFVIDGSDPKKDQASWIKGAKKVPLTILDPDANSRIIWAELGVYSFLGTPCDEF
ncbi:MAG: hypothetical protein ABI467_13960 [Kofleriaceae bacterium]